MIDIENMKRVCNACGASLVITLFATNGSFGKNYIRRQCLACTNKKARERYRTLYAGRKSVPAASDSPSRLKSKAHSKMIREFLLQKYGKKYDGFSRLPECEREIARKEFKEWPPRKEVVASKAALRLERMSNRVYAAINSNRMRANEFAGKSEQEISRIQLMNKLRTRVSSYQF